MASEIPGFVLGTETAGADLTGKQYRFGKGSAGVGIILATAAAKVMGVIQNAPDVGDVVELMVNGVSKVICDDPVTQYSVVEVGNEGGCMNLSAGDGVGIALETGVEGQVISVLLKDYDNS